MFNELCDKIHSMEKKHSENYKNTVKTYLPVEQNTYWISRQVKCRTLYLFCDYYEHLNVLLFSI